MLEPILIRSYILYLNYKGTYYNLYKDIRFTHKFSNKFLFLISGCLKLFDHDIILQKYVSVFITHTTITIIAINVKCDKISCAYKHYKE